ncbi:PIG-L deacetylase family protein [Salinivibrio sharmensis]|uniref:GlcNAc-PI de-N-acetylase n=1 Tax=Salinivibrio sharmensis TaxID=390883 RepID=A0ABX3K8W7_9GAMM|nr:PIG-L family deacetylase [Salinivibrio sharmensis]OOE85048.1 GlcNAc-PI de-N-acetylase [Salinivibrio sharmensis]
MKSVLIIAAHPDDEVLGCGGTIAKHIHNGDKVSIKFMTNGVAARPGIEDRDVEKRKQSALKALDVLGVEEENIVFGEFPDNSMDILPLIEVVKSIEKIVEEVNPEIIYTHFSNDLNIDHRISHQAVMTACRPQSSSPVKEIYCYEVLSSTEWNSYTCSKFNPNKFVSITQFWQKKSEALYAYHQEMRDFPHSRSFETVEALATLRGAIVGLQKAEAFQIERIIENEK